MSYHTHNLVDGDVFTAPLDLWAYVDSDWMDAPQHLFEVLDVEHSAYMTPDFRWWSGRLDYMGWYMHLVARCLVCGETMNAVVDKDISLAMVEEDELERYVREWKCQ